MESLGKDATEKDNYASMVTEARSNVPHSPRKQLCSDKNMNLKDVARDMCTNMINAVSQLAVSMICCSS